MRDELEKILHHKPVFTIPSIFYLPVLSKPCLCHFTCPFMQQNVLAKKWLISKFQGYLNFSLLWKMSDVCQSKTSNTITNPCVATLFTMTSHDSSLNFYLPSSFWIIFWQIIKKPNILSLICYYFSLYFWKVILLKNIAIPLSNLKKIVS